MQDEYMYNVYVTWSGKTSLIAGQNFDLFLKTW